jgi:hypothetical protein
MAAVTGDEVLPYLRLFGPAHADLSCGFCINLFELRTPPTPHRVPSITDQRTILMTVWTKTRGCELGGMHTQAQTTTPPVHILPINLRFPTALLGGMGASHSVN